MSQIMNIVGISQKLQTVPLKNARHTRTNNPASSPTKAHGPLETHPHIC